MKAFLKILGLLISIQNTSGQERITDFLSGDGDKSSSPTGFVEFGQKIFFQANTESFGREIWVTNGNINEAFLLKDIYPGNNNGIQGLFSNSYAIINNTLYFIANDGSSRGEIWKTDGTTEGTEKVTDFLNYNINVLTQVGDNFYFLMRSGDSLQVWISDGSQSGTKVVQNNLPIWNEPTFQGKCNNTFIFTFQPYGTNNSRVWRSDGTSSGTYPITGEIDGNGAGLGGTSALSHYIEFNNELYFMSRYYLHKTDGTLENTVNVTTMHNGGSFLIDYGDAVIANGKLYFSFFTLDYNKLFIWESDGTEPGSSIIYDESGSRYFMTSNLIGNENALIFCGVNNTGGTSLIHMNLNDNSLNYLKELKDTSEIPFIFIEYFDICIIQFIGENKIYCSVPDEDYQRKGWISGLTEETTFNAVNLINVENMYQFENSSYFSNYTELAGYELWKYDGTEDNFYLIDNINKSRYGLSNQPLASLNSNLIFTANDGMTGVEIWKYNEASSLLKDIRKGSGGSNCNSLVMLNNTVFFVANDSIHGFELWKTDGTETGTMIVNDIIGGIGSSFPEFLTIHNDKLYFITYINEHFQLCKTDGNNIEIIKDLGENEFGFANRVTEIYSSGNYLFIAAHGAGADLWISDGTSEGSYVLKHFNTCRNLTEVNGKLFFVASETYDEDEELWSTDGSESLTKLVKEIGVGYSAKPDNLISYNGALFFTAYTAENGREIWTSDGTETGTIQLIDINPGSQSSLTNANFCIANSILFLIANDGENGFELWKTDGSESGTILVKDINSGIRGSFPKQLASIKDLLYFQAYDPEHGSELWKSDGTESGTILASDILPGFQSSLPTNICLIDNEVFFIAEFTDIGRQIWRMTYNSISSVKESSYYNDLTVFPNPCSDFIQFNAKVGKVYMYNSNGHLISVIKFEDNRIDISDLPSGLYLMKFSIDGVEINKKIIKQ